MSAEFSPDGAMIATAGADGTARVWDAATGRQVADGALTTTLRSTLPSQTTAC